MRASITVIDKKNNNWENNTYGYIELEPANDKSLKLLGKTLVTIL